MTTVTEDQHGMTSRSSATATQEVSHSSYTQRVNSVLSEPMHTMVRSNDNTKDGPLRTMSIQQSKQLKQLSIPERNQNSSQTPQRNYYKPSKDTKTYFANSQGHLQYREDPQEIIKPNKKGKLPDSKEVPIYHEPGLITINSTEELKALLSNSFDRLGNLRGEYNIKIDPTVQTQQHLRIV